MKTEALFDKEKLYENLTIYNEKTGVYRKIKKVYGEHAITYQLDENDEDYVIFIGDIFENWVVAKELNIYTNIENKIKKLQEVFEKYEEILPENILMFNENFNELLLKIQENKEK